LAMLLLNTCKPSEKLFKAETPLCKDGIIEITVLCYLLAARVTHL